MNEKRDNSTTLHIYMDEKTPNYTRARVIGRGDTGALVWLHNESVEWDPPPWEERTCFSAIKVPKDIAEANPELFQQSWLTFNKGNKRN